MNFIKRVKFSFTGAGYISVFMLLLLALWNPVFSFGQGPVDLMLLLDESNSVKADQASRIWRSFIQWGQLLPQDSRISLLRFADRSKIEVPWLPLDNKGFSRLSGLRDPPRHTYLDPEATDLVTALGRAIDYTNGKHRSAIIIASDGIDTINTGQKLIPLENNNTALSLFFIELEQDKLLSPLIMESVNLPAKIDPGQAVPVSVSIHSPQGGNGMLEINLNGSTLVSQALTLTAQQRQVINLHTVIKEPGVHQLTLILYDHNGNILHQQHHVVDSRGTGRLLYIARHSETPTLNDLHSNGWQVLRIEPHEIPVDENFFSRFDLIIMDDVDAASINSSNTDNLIRAIEIGGSGLIVLGGQHSFASGSYRHSALEKILPVISEASTTLPSVATLFLLDKSGSMEAAGRLSSRLSDALVAVTESAKSLRPGDESALLAFDRDVDVLLPLKKRGNLLSELDKNWKLLPSGGTKLAPALAQAGRLLAQSNSTERFLILVTDGFVEQQNMEQLKHQFKQANIRLIVLATGLNADLSTLQELASINRGRVLKVNDTAELPRIMRRQVEQERNSWSSSPVIPQSAQPLPFLPSTNIRWKTLHGYQLTRIKETAKLYVSTDSGEPLLASFTYGAGRVSAMPGGILQPNSNSNVTGALFNWMNQHRQNPNLDITHDYQSGWLNLNVDAVDPDNQWQLPVQASVRLTSPAGKTYTQALEAVAPGRFATAINAKATGVYSARIEVGSEYTAFTSYLANDSEQTLYTIAPWLQQALSRDQIQPWNDRSLDDLLASSSAHQSSRPVWLLFALISYLSVLTVERPSSLNQLKAWLLSLSLRRKAQ